MMRRQGHDLDLLNEKRRNVVLDAHVKLEELSSTWYVHCGDVDGESFEMSLVTRG